MATSLVEAGTRGANRSISKRRERGRVPRVPPPSLDARKTQTYPLSALLREGAELNGSMARIVVIGNAGGGKSTLARRLAERRGLTHVEIDRLLWQDGWVPAPEDDYQRRHREIIGQDQWIIDGVGRQNSIAERIGRATEIILIDMPLWMHFWLAAERQIAWVRGTLDQKPGGIAQMPPTRDLFRTIWEVDQTWMPGIRTLCTEAETGGKIVTRLTSVDELDAFAGRN
jgi:hypothetical protein